MSLFEAVVLTVNAVLTLHLGGFGRVYGVLGLVRANKGHLQRWDMMATPGVQALDEREYGFHE